MIEGLHSKGRDCALTEKVLEKYRQRAIKAELEVVRLQRVIDSMVEVADTLFPDQEG